MRAFTRLGASVFAMVLSLMTILALLPQSRYTEHLRKIEIGGTSINDVTDGLWDWASGDDGGDGEEAGVRLVIFGDSWVDDTVEENEDGKGRSWTEVLCEELSCTSKINLAVSQPSSSYPSSPPTGAFASNKVYLSSIEDTAGQNNNETKITAESMLPDLEAQVKSFIALPLPKKKLRETIFVVSFGTWDIWHYASLDYTKAQEAQNKAVAEIFAQLDNLYAHHRENLEATHVIVKPHNDSHVVAKPQFRIVIQKLFDPTMLPGWLSQRPIPLKPSSVAENQKNAISLVRDWDNSVENFIKPWFASTPEATTTSEWAEPAPEEQVSGDAVPETSDQNDQQSQSQGKRESEGDVEAESKPDIPPPQKDIYYYDLNRFLTEIIIEHQLEDEGLSDASGLGTKESPYISVYDPCVRAGDDGESKKRGPGEKRKSGKINKGNEKRGEMKDTKSLPDINGLLVCEQPDEYLFWDDFNMGSQAKELVGKEIAKMVREGKTLRKSWGDGTVPGV
ncbi:hypothetical protein BCIN_14g05220 [Botrytis cinerea B05.10]|uniref:SGNH hydrolase-type esterase domain-containing protein n=1 Tax=Botryotinia fuckeliana (strain B05.10) TaxID=332648 RepID=A0A384K3F1_BOTFB|nr:hypothetical protein BCIN_14g05220 [Botrytis cinerea B05.10]ATZ57376.1 hypothetical protein BCIN_14g05220 [Botrytis cinerea B05.10]